MQKDAKCWAAALSSWLKVVRKKDVSIDDLVQKFKNVLVVGGNGGLNPGKIDVVLNNNW
jgi:hypothetical protein